MEMRSPWTISPLSVDGMEFSIINARFGLN